MKDRRLGILLSYVNTGLNMVCGLLMSAYLLRELGDTEYGLYKTISSFANTLVLFEFGTGTVMTRNITACLSRQASQAEITRNISTIWVINNLLAVLVAICSCFFYFSLDNIYSNSLNYEQIEYGRKIFVYIACYMISSFYIQTIEGIIIAYEFYSIISMLRIFKIVIRTVVLIVLLRFWKKSIFIAILDMMINLGLLLYMVLFCTKKTHVSFTLKQFDPVIFKHSLPLCLAIFIQVIVNQANSNVDNFIIGIKVNPESVALYSVGLYVYSVFSSLTTIPISMYGPQVIKNVSNGIQGRDLTDTLISPSRLIVLVGGSVLFGFLAAGREFIEIVYGHEYVVAWVYAIIIMVPMFVNMSNGIIVNVLDALNKRMERSKVLLVTTIINLILTVIFLSWWGIIGACIATAVATVLGQIIYMNLYYQRVLKIDVIYLFRKTYQGIIPYQIVAMIAAFLAGGLATNIYVCFFVKIVLFIIVFGCLFFFKGATIEERHMLLSKIKRVK